MWVGPRALPAAPHAPGGAPGAAYAARRGARAPWALSLAFSRALRGAGKAGKVCVRSRASDAQRRWEVLRGRIWETPASKELERIEGEVREGTRCHPNAEARYFSSSRRRPRVTFYRDSSALCPKCQAVWLLLEAKKIDYLVVKEDLRAYGQKSAEFLKKVPSGALPAIEVEGRWATDSLDAMFLLERLFPDEQRPMFPSFSRMRGSALQLLELHRGLLEAWRAYIFRKERPFLEESAVNFESGLEQVQRALEKNDSSWFLPYEHPTIVDIAYVCSMERMVASALFYKALDIRELYPGIDTWLRSFEQLPWYKATKGDIYSHCVSLEPQHGPAAASLTGPALRLREQLLPENYRLPFKFERDLEALTQGDTTKRIHYVQASWSLVKNSEALVRYMCRAAGGQQGRWARGRADRSRLADPQARVLEALLPALEPVLCALAEVIFEEAQAEVVKQRMREAAQVPDLWPQLSLCLAYLRDRIAVPRDLPLPSAKVLRSYIAVSHLALRKE